MIIATYATYADADCVRCDTRDDDDMLHHLLVPIFSAIVVPDVPTACLRIVNQLIEEFDDDDPDAIDTPADFDIAHMPDDELNSEYVRVFCVKLKSMPVAHVIMRQV